MRYIEVMKNIGNKLSAFLLFLFFMQVATSPSITEAGSRNNDPVKKAIVKIYASQTRPDYMNPWSSGSPSQISGSGAILSGHRILTNAHVVANSTFIEVRLHGQSKRYKARVQNVSHEADLAILKVEDESFFKGTRPLKIGPLPESQQEVLVYGFPIGGDSLSITKGILSRIEHQSYVHSGSSFLAGQIDAAINPGNSGGPVIVGKKIAGVVMQSYNSRRSESLGYMVPSPVIQHFLKDLEDGRYDGFPVLGMQTQTIESRDMKRRFGMKNSQTGVLVNYIYFNSPAKGLLRPDDIVMEVDGHSIEDDGTVEFRHQERTSYSYFIEMHQLRDEVNLKILREGKVKKLKFALKNKRDDFQLVASKQHDKLPRYFIYAGILFTPLSNNLISQMGRGWSHSAPPELLYAMSRWPNKDKRELVVALKVLPDDLNRGYHRIKNWAVAEVNGKKFKDFNEFIKIVTGSGEPFTVFKNSKGSQIVIDRKKAEEGLEKILKTYRIKEDRSPDLINESQK